MTNSDSNVVPMKAPEPWSRARYQAEIQSKLMADFEGLTPESIQEDVSKVSIYTRMDIDPKLEVGEKFPGSENVVLAMFDGDRVAGDILVYVFPSAAAPEGERAWLRYTVSRVGAVPMVERMPRVTFVSELADEWAALLGYDEDEEEEVVTGAEDVEPVGG